MIAPPPVGRKPVAFYDTECYPNYWLLKFKVNLYVYSYSLRFGQTFTIQQRQEIQRLFEIFTTISFNGNNYDVPMICAAMQGLDPTQLRMINDRIILEKVKPWELGLPEWKPADHIDIIEVAPGTGSQKQYAGRIHQKRIWDLPYPVDTMLTDEQIDTVDLYCENDLADLLGLYEALKPQLDQREGLGARYGLDLRSKSDAQLAEAVLKYRCEQALGRKLYKPDINWYLQFKYQVPAYIQYTLPQLQRALEIVRNSTFGIRPPASMRIEGFETGKCIVMPVDLEGLTIKINNTTYKLGVGGIHSQEEKAVHLSDDVTVLRDIDVAAYYPSLILNSGAWPPALGETFLKEYGAIKDERILTKKYIKEVKSEISKLKDELKRYENS